MLSPPSVTEQWRKGKTEIQREVKVVADKSRDS